MSDGVLAHSCLFERVEEEQSFACRRVVLRGIETSWQLEREMQEVCSDCEDLSQHPMRIGSPPNLSRIATLRRSGEVSFQYECRHCQTYWECTQGHGWRRESTMPIPVPLLLRVADVARATLSRLGI